MSGLHRSNRERVMFFVCSKYTKLHTCLQMPPAGGHELSFFLHRLSLDVRHGDLRLESDPAATIGHYDSGWHGSHNYPASGQQVPTFNATLHYAGEDGAFLRGLQCRLVPWFLMKLSLEVYVCDQVAVVINGDFVTRLIPNLCVLVRVALKPSAPSRPTPVITSGIQARL
jgi:hypothetical protein